MSIHLDPAAGFLIFLWILLDIKSSRDEQRAAEEAGVQIDTRQGGGRHANNLPRRVTWHPVSHDAVRVVYVGPGTGAAGRVESYWGFSFWLFFAATLVTSIGAMFGCC